MKRLWKQDLAFAACVVALYPEVIFASARIIGRDALLYLIPLGAVVREGLIGGGSLLWDASVNHGLPLIGRWSPMVFYPPQWLNAVFRPETAYTAEVLVHLWLAAAAAMRLSLRATPSVAAAWLAGAAYAFGGYVVSMTVAGGYLFGAALLPLSLLAVLRLAESATAVRAAQLAAVAALQILVADPQTLFYEALFFAPALLWLHAPTGGGRAKRFGLAAAAGAVALAIGACQWVPAAEFARLSVRAAGVANEAGIWAFHPLRVVQLWSPHVLGSVTPENTFWARSLVNAPDLTKPWAPLVYNGLLIWVGLGFVAWKQLPTALRWLGGAGLAALICAMGERGGLWRVLTAVLPGAGFFRYPEKFLVFFTLALCVVAAAGLGRLVAELSVRDVAAGLRRRRAAAALGLFAIAAGAGWAWLSGDRLGWFSALVQEQRADYVDPAVALRMVASSFGHSALAAAGLAAVLAAGPRLRPALAAAALIAIAVTDLVLASLPQRSIADGTPYRGTPASCAALPPPVAGLKPQVWRVVPAELTLPVPSPDEGSKFEVEQRRDWETLRANTGAASCIRQVDAYEAARLATWGRLWRATATEEARRLRLFGVEYLVAPSGTFGNRFPFVTGSEALMTEVFRVPDPLPYAQPLAVAEGSAGVEAAIDRVADPAFDFTRAIVLDHAGGAAFTDAPRTATLRAHRSGDVTVDVDFGDDGFLLLQETWYPGWRADVDGAPAAIERANGHFLAVQVPRGRHAVRAIFDPPVQRAANWVACAGLLALGGLAAAGRARWLR